MKTAAWLVPFIFLCLAGHCQKMVYASANNVVLRDRPGKQYNVFAILKKGCPLTVEPYEFAEKDTLVKKAFYHVSINYSDGTYHHHIIGWVIKKYLNPRGDSTLRPVDAYFDQIIPVYDFNAGDYPPPKYKGAEAQPRKAARKYLKGPRGGCYYLSDKGHKVYVDKKYCEEAKNRKK